MMCLTETDEFSETIDQVCFSGLRFESGTSRIQNRRPNCLLTLTFSLVCGDVEKKSGFCT